MVLGVFAVPITILLAPAALRAALPIGPPAEIVERPSATGECLVDELVVSVIGQCIRAPADHCPTEDKAQRGPQSTTPLL
jgi:hypothetical protein